MTVLFFSNLPTSLPKENLAILLVYGLGCRGAQLWPIPFSSAGAPGKAPPVACDLELDFENVAVQPRCRIIRRIRLIHCEISIVTPRRVKD